MPNASAPVGRPFDDIRGLLRQMPAIDEAAVNKVRARQMTLIKPPGSLGRLETMVEWLAGWQGKAEPTLDRPTVAVFAANHGVNAQGVSAWPSDVTRVIMESVSSGKAAISQICAANDLGLKVFDLALNVPTKDFTVSAAMEEADCAATMAFGMEALAGEPDLLMFGEVGIGNTTSAAAIYHALYGGAASDWTGRGAGADEAQMTRKITAVEAGVKLHAAALADPLEVLRRLGGREIAAIAGAILAARLQRIPVLLDGFVVCAAAAVLHALDPRALDHCMAAHVSGEMAHRVVLERLGLQPVFDMGMRLGEGTGAALVAPLLKSALATHKGMATFADIGLA